MVHDENTTTATVHVDNRVFEVATKSMSGGQLKALVGKDLQYQLFIERSESRPDEMISDTDSIRIESGMRFYTVPPAVFGS